LATIHPSSIVDPRAQIADDVQVGPHCILDGAVTIGPGCRLLGNAYLKGPLTIGRGNRIYPFAALGLEPQDRKYNPDTDGAGTLIGDDNIIREGVTIHRATGNHATTVGSRNYLMAYSHVGHDGTIGNDCAIANGVLLAGHVEIGDRVIMGGAAVVHQFCRIGRMAVQSGACGVNQDVPPFCAVHQSGIIVAINVVGLRRAGLREHIKPLEEAFRMFFQERRALDNALPLVEKQLGTSFVRASKRGICRFDRKQRVYHTRTEGPIIPDEVL
jgi:UDP-N-acetylglucosamine acyltransferase